MHMVVQDTSGVTPGKKNASPQLLLKYLKVLETEQLPQCHRDPDSHMESHAVLAQMGI